MRRLRLRGIRVGMDAPRSENSPAYHSPEAWFAAEVHPHDAHLKAYLRGAFPAVRDVDDIVQESYLRIWRAGPGAGLRSARAFLFRVARNLAVDLLRDRKRFRPVGVPAEEVAVFDASADAGRPLLRQERIERLASALNRLPARQREVLVHCKLYGRTYRETATLLRLSEKTVTEHVYRGMQRLTAELAPAPGGEGAP